MNEGCPFCDYAGPSPILANYEGAGVFVIEPTTPVVPGHVLVVPRIHVESAFEASALTGLVAKMAVRYAREAGIRSANIISSVGAAATQTVPHLHFHVVPRSEGDRLQLPWSQA